MGRGARLRRPNGQAPPHQKGPLEAAQWVDWGCTALLCVSSQYGQRSRVLPSVVPWHPEAYRDVPPPYRVGSDSSPEAGTDGRPCLVRPHGRTSSSTPHQERTSGDTTQVRRDVPGAPRQTRLCYTNGGHTYAVHSSQGQAWSTPSPSQGRERGFGRGEGGMGARTPPCRPQSTLFRLSIPTQSAGPACMQASSLSARLAAASAQQHAASQDEGFAWIGPFGNQRRYRYIPSPLPAPRTNARCSMAASHKFLRVAWRVRSASPAPTVISPAVYYVGTYRIENTEYTCTMYLGCPRKVPSSTEYSVRTICILSPNASIRNRTQHRT